MLVCKEEFSIAYSSGDSKDLLSAWEEILESGRWSEGDYLARFEEAWASLVGLYSAGVSSWWGGALGVLDYANVKGSAVLCPGNTYLATARAIQASGGEPHFYDCNLEDLCGSYESFVKVAEKVKPKAAFVVHIGGHIAFEIKEIAEYCRINNIFLIEDCAHAHGASWNGSSAGSWGDAGIYSFYATKTITTGEGGMVVSRNQSIIQHVASFRNYGKFSNGRVQGGNYRLDEFRAALGFYQTKRLPDIIKTKQAHAHKLDQIFHNRVMLPDGMTSGYYKYIIFEEIPNSTGKVYKVPCYKIFEPELVLENTDWISKNHWCVPIYVAER